MKIKQEDCNAQTIQVAGLNLGIVDLENRVAYVPDSDTFTRRMDELELWKAMDITMVYYDFIQDLRKKGFSVVHYGQKSTAKTREVYDIFA